MDPRKDRLAWKRGDAYVVVRFDEGTAGPAWWDGTDDPLREAAGGRSFGHFSGNDVIVVLNEDIRSWPYMTSFHVGIDCVWQGRRVWFVVDEDPQRDDAAKPFAYDLIKIA